MNKVVVLGSFVVDLMARADHLPVPGETVIGSFFKYGPGGKGSNQAVAAHRSGSDVKLITKVGNDLFAHIPLDFYKKEGMDTTFVFQDGRYMTGNALILVDEHTSQNSILVTPGACEQISSEEIDQAAEVLTACNVFLTQLEINLDVIPKAVSLARSNHGITVLNPAPVKEVDPSLIGLFDIVTPNEIEASLLTGIQVTDFTSAEKAAKVFQGMGVKDVIITIGKQGAFVIERTGESYSVTPMDVDVIDTTGAGDAFSGGLVTALAEGKPLKEAVMFATATASLCVTSIGTAPSMPQRAEIENLLSSYQQ